MITIPEILEHVHHHLIAMTIWNDGRASMSIEVCDCLCACSALCLQWKEESLPFCWQIQTHLQDGNERGTEIQWFLKQQFLVII